MHKFIRIQQRLRYYIDYFIVSKHGSGLIFDFPKDLVMMVSYL